MERQVRRSVQVTHPANHAADRPRYRRAQSVDLPVRVRSAVCSNKGDAVAPRFGQQVEDSTSSSQSQSTCSSSSTRTVSHTPPPRYSQTRPLRVWMSCSASSASVRWISAKSHSVSGVRLKTDPAEIVDTEAPSLRLTTALGSRPTWAQRLNATERDSRGRSAATADGSAFASIPPDDQHGRTVAFRDGIRNAKRLRSTYLVRS